MADENPKQQSLGDALDVAGFTWGQYMKVGLVLTPPVLLATLVALWVWLPIVS